MQSALLLGLVLLTAWTLGGWVALGVFVTGVWLTVRAYRAQPCGELHVMQDGDRWEGCWLQSTGEPGAKRAMRCDYLGPWLVGLRIGSRRLWIWPDSLANARHQRALRRCFHRPGR